MAFLLENINFTLTSWKWLFLKKYLAQKSLLLNLLMGVISALKWAIPPFCIFNSGEVREHFVWMLDEVTLNGPVNHLSTDLLFSGFVIGTLMFSGVSWNPGGSSGH